MKINNYFKNKFLKVFVVAFVFVLLAIVLVTGGNVVVKNGQLNVSDNLLVSNNALFINSSSGNVGIGKTTPGAKLDVNGNIRTQQICDENGANCKDISTGWASGDGYSLDAADGNPVDVVYVDNAGNVGVGTTSPSTKLNIRQGVLLIEQPGTTYDVFHSKITSETVQRFQITAIGQLSWGSGTTIPQVDTLLYRSAQSTLRTNSNFIVDGNVGIGTESPSYKLEVNGTARVSGTLNVGYVRRSCSYTVGASFQDCSCSAGEVVISGGTYTLSPGSMRESRPISTTTWRVACVDGSGNRKDCGPVDILCARLGAS